MDHGHQAYNPFKQLNGQKLQQGKLGHVSHQIMLLLTSFMTTSDINHSEQRIPGNSPQQEIHLFRLMSLVEL
jgi:hypothetical protein